MIDYKSMYFNLFNKITDAIKILQAVQQETEDTYIKSEDELSVLSKKDDNEN